jgi:signal transduction histidine kinase/serine/threonine protein kinase/tetratricopeptide (TPR) repeat protein
MEDLKLKNSRVSGSDYLGCRITDVLKSEPEGQTLLGIHHFSQKKVVIKSVPTKSDSQFFMRLKRKVTLFQNLSDPHLPRPIQFEFFDNSVHLITPYAPGISLKEKLEQGRLSLEEIIVLARELLSTLKVAHSNGVIHRNIKSSNVIVDSEKKITSARLIDFGFAKTVSLHSSSSKNLLEGASYVSPEQAGLIESPIDEKSDLYSLGILLYECINGELPFKGETLTEILRQQLYRSVPKVSVKNNKLKEALIQLVDHLLEKDPRNRYQTAEGALADLTRIAEVANSGKDNEVLIGLHDRRSEIAHPHFIGRFEELTKLSLCLELAREGRSQFVSVEAESGGGKTKLLQELVKKFDVDEFKIFWGQGKDQVAQIPFQVFLPIFKTICEISSRDRIFKERLRQSLAEVGPTLISIYQPFSEIFSKEVELSLIGPEAFGEIRNLEALTKLFLLLATFRPGVLFILDDFQWADELSLRFIGHWMRAAANDTTPHHSLVIIAYRSEEVPDSHPLRELAFRTKLELLPLDQKATSALLESMAGPLPPEVNTKIFESAQGNPFMTSALLRGLVESKTLLKQGDEWVCLDVERDFQPSQEATALIKFRFKFLTESTLAMIKIAAVVGKTFDLATLSSLSKIEASIVLELLEEALRKQIIWEQANGYFSFVHDKLRETVLDMMPETDRKKLHLQIANFLEEKPKKNPFDIAYHYDAAGWPKRGLPYSVRAAVEARRKNSLKVAEQQYQISLKGLAKSGSYIQSYIFINLGHVLMLQGNYSQASEFFDKALQLDLGKTTKSYVWSLKGELLFKEGRIDAASEALERALNVLGINVPSNFTWATLSEVCVQTFHSIFPKWFYQRDREMDWQTRLAARILSRLAYTYWFGRGRSACAWAHFKEINLCERYRASLELAQAYSEHGPVLTMLPYFSRAKRYVEKSLKIRETFQDFWGQGQSNHFLGVVHYSASRFEEAIDRCRKAVRIMSRAGDRWEVNTANWHIADSLYRLGRLKEAAELAQRIYEDGRKIGDRVSSSIAISIWAKAAQGRIPLAPIEQALRESDEDVHTKAESLQAKAIYLLQNGNSSEAATILHNGIRLIEAKGFRQEYVCSLYPWYATALRREVESLDPYANRERNLLFQKLERACKKALRISYFYRNNLPHALRESALAAALHGKSSKCRRLLEKSIVVAEEQNAQYELTLSHLELAKLNLKFGWGLPDLSLTHAQSRSNQFSTILPRPDGKNESTLTLYNQFQKIQDFGIQLFACRDVDSVIVHASRITREIFNADQSCIVRLHASSDGTSFEELTKTPQIALDLIARLVHEARTRKEPFILEDLRDSELNERLMIDGIQSMIAFPLFLRNKMSHIIFGFTEKVAKVHGENERNLALFTCRVISAALENLEYVRKLRESNEDLERFAYIASHDLQEPLRTISSWTGILKDELGDLSTPSTQEAFKFVLEGAARMSGLIRALLNFSHVAQNDGELSVHSIRSLLDTAIKNISQTMKDSSAQISITGAFPHVDVNPVHFVQVFQNLIGNAIKFRRNEPPVIQIACHEVPAQRMWQIDVIDNGIGIEPQHSARIFEAFKRLHTREEFDGNGIGLSIAKKVIERHGGQIWVESTPGVGSKFSFTLPIR